jgi:hypothetical protein
MSIVVFANNQCMVADGSTGNASEITTDPVPLNGLDRAALILTAHYFFGGGGSGGGRNFQVFTQVSNDGTNFLDLGAAVQITAVSDTPVRDTRACNAGYLRYRFVLNPVAAQPDCHICFDLHVNLDKS